MNKTRLSLLHRAWRMLPQQQRRQLLLRLATTLSPRAQQPPPDVSLGVIVAGELSRASGLGETARLMLAVLPRIGVPCWPLDIGPLLPAHAQDISAASATSFPPGAALLLHVNPPMLPLVLLRLRHLVRDRRLIGCWVWELPVAPASWRDAAGFAHAAWVPSHFTADAVEPLMPGRVSLAPYPLALSPPDPAPLDRSAFGLPAEAVVVLVSANLASSYVRKNPSAAVTAFRQAFGDREDRVLVLKIGNPDHFPRDFAALRAAVAGAPNIRLESRILPPADSYALTRAADIVLSLHRSEGFGLVLAEAMLLARPVVGTGWSGNMMFMDETNSVPLPYSLVPVVDPRGVYAAPGAVWAEPDVAAAATALRALAEQPEHRAALGARARDTVMARLDAAGLVLALRGLGLRPQS